jgi:hypothetical protein
MADWVKSRPLTIEAKDVDLVYEVAMGVPELHWYDMYRPHLTGALNDLTTFRVS